MSDLISRQAAIDAIGEKSDEIFKTKQKGATYPHDDFFQGMAYAENVVKQLPPAQPERIVRCKDCKHWIPYDWMFSEVWRSKNMADYPEDEIGCNYCDMTMKANDFCSRGERRTNE